MDAEFAGRVVAVTGGTRGIGLAIADAFREAGATVVTLARSKATYDVDLVDEDRVAEAFAALQADHHRLDVLVNNAGGARPGPADTYPAKHARHALELNVLAVLLASQHAYRFMPDGGSIVNLGSIAGTRPSPGTAVYGAAKAAVSALTRSLALEWAPRIRVNSVVPGPVLTDTVVEYYGGAEAAARKGRDLPLGRMAEPSDIAEACLFLSSRRAAYMSGAELLVHGGGEMPHFNRER